MFRNPRENAARVTDDAILPSTGRAPTPPAQRIKDENNSPYLTRAASMVSPRDNSVPNGSNRLVIGRAVAPKSSVGKRREVGQNKNKSILSFFEKAGVVTVKQEKPESEDGLFVEDDRFERSVSPEWFRAPSVTEPGLNDDEEDTLRYNEVNTSSKRRRLEDDDLDNGLSPPRTPPETNCISNGNTSTPTRKLFTSSKTLFGRTIDSGEEREGASNALTSADTFGRSEPALKPPNGDLPEIHEQSVGVQHHAPEHNSEEVSISKGLPGISHTNEQSSLVLIPSLPRDETSIAPPEDFPDDDFADEEFYEGGEEVMERRWMEEQAQMEADFDDDDSRSEAETSIATPISEPRWFTDEIADAVETSCPICSGSMTGLSETQASTHVNACLDGTAAPLPKQTDEPKPQLVQPALSGSRFKRAGIARPAQSNPFALENGSKEAGKSAFTRLMSGHAEDAAWAEAATNEAQSRGKPAYQRTCPFYKIMPGMFICVDAFRFGKVEGQNAYFLSHFHSDHYIGLTSSWSHGLIYASKVTINLIRTCLRVDEKWLVPLVFEQKTAVPNTSGVSVTMIPANHCPGSSLFLFEKVTGKQKDGSPKLNRILHCGDFRACPAHIHHPLLKPDVIDTISGQTKQQVIDTCYLDTTYLTPKYAFPGQHDVIDACAQMCISLSKEIVDTGDAWEKVKAERAGSVMTKFLEQTDTSGSITGSETAPIALTVEEQDDIKPKSRGRLLVVIGTYSIGKERICLGIAKALNSKIFAPPSKMRICRCLEDAELNSYLTSNPLDAQVHMQTLMEIRAETLHDYLVGFKPHFSRVVGFRPTGWNYRPPTSRFTENPAVSTVLHSEGWKSRFTMRDLAPQRGSTKESNCFGVPYSEHSSFRELTMFVCALRIGRVVPTVNVGSVRSREKMKGWIEKWEVEKRKQGLYQVDKGTEGWGSGDGGLRYGV